MALRGAVRMARSTKAIRLYEPFAAEGNDAGEMQRVRLLGRSAQDMHRELFRLIDPAAFLGADGHRNQ
jgi:hypothetical protein